jgi:hypothetical protein
MLPPAVTLREFRLDRFTRFRFSFMSYLVQLCGHSRRRLREAFTSELETKGLGVRALVSNQSMKSIESAIGLGDPLDFCNEFILSNM